MSLGLSPQQLNEPVIKRKQNAIGFQISKNDAAAGFVVYHPRRVCGLDADSELSRAGQATAVSRAIKGHGLGPRTSGVIALSTGLRCSTTSESPATFQTKARSHQLQEARFSCALTSYDDILTHRSPVGIFKAILRVNDIKPCIKTDHTQRPLRSTKNSVLAMATIHVACTPGRPALPVRMPLRP